MMEAEALSERTANVVGKLDEIFGGADRPAVVRAPGRVNIIGEHTDYNGGFVLPIAIARDTLVACRRNGTRTVRIHSLDFDRTGEFHLDHAQKRTDLPWLNYPQGVAACIERGGARLTGVDCAVQGSVPIGGGLSSSASVEVAFALAFCEAGQIEIDRKSLALLCQKAENDFVGVNCGIMDQYVSLFAKKGHAVLIDCKNLKHDLVPVDNDRAEFIVCNTGVKRELGASEYNARRAHCEEAAAKLGVKLLRDVSQEDFEARCGLLSDVVRKRARHVITEDVRTNRAVDALKARDLPEVGRQMNASHESLRADYEVSCKELDIMVEIARRVEGAYGARMTGAGFGGCTVNLVAKESVEEFTAAIKREYAGRTGIEPAVLVTTAEDGAGRVEP